MADIRVKPVKRTPIWVWMLVVLLVIAAGAAVIYFWPTLNPALLSLLSV